MADIISKNESQKRDERSAEVRPEKQYPKDAGRDSQGISNRPAEEEKREQAKLPERGHAKDEEEDE
jgi:hypothetical protein